MEPPRVVKAQCEPPPLLNRFCGKLPLSHHEIACHNESEKKRRIINEVKKLMDEWEELPKCEQWDTRMTGNTTKGPYRFGVWTHETKPWDRDRIPSRELIGGKMINNCDCLMRNGLQDDCRRTQCRGRPLCMTQPMPKCPPFTHRPAQIIDKDPWEECERKPWKEYRP